MICFRRSDDGWIFPLIGEGYGAHDVFYQSDGGCNALENCNEWTAASCAPSASAWVCGPTAPGTVWRLH